MVKTICKRSFHPVSIPCYELPSVSSFRPSFTSRFRIVELRSRGSWAFTVALFY